ncbi:MAG TPA: cobalt-precorrin-5B (C(1))-methyltransferase [Terriglobia bacterium]|nr:cobalt-precorrin-5B (C(1))-methyltransferase [Terriglobia bacterium]
MTRKPEAPDQPLRRGWTTGACATAATKAALTALLTGEFPDPVTITLPKGERPSFALARHARLEDGRCMAAVIKDAGDDPDVTHLAEIRATVRRLPEGSGIVFKAGYGVGTVTKPGLPLAVGEPAINPVPRRLMTEVATELTAAHHLPADIEIEISVPAGLELAPKTWNPRLGILDGISILGTTGVVNPFSCSAWIASIHRGIDVIRATGLTHAAACTGSTTEAAVQARYGLPDFAFIDMGDFAGGTLKYLRHHPVEKLTLAGGFGKFCKLADGFLDLHSGRSQVNHEHLAAIVAELGGDAALVEKVRSANTAMEVLELSQAAHLDLANVLAARAREVALEACDRAVDIEILIYDRKGGLVGHAGFAKP